MSAPQCTICDKQAKYHEDIGPLCAACYELPGIVTDWCGQRHKDVMSKDCPECVHAIFRDRLLTKLELLRTKKENMVMREALKKVDDPSEVGSCAIRKMAREASEFRAAQQGTTHPKS